MVGVPAIAIALLLLAGGAPDAPPVSVQYWAIEATAEGREAPYFDASAKPIRTLLEDLRFDTFVTLCTKAERLPLQQEKKAALTHRYTMGLRYTGPDAAGRARVVVTVMLAPRQPKGSPQKAVETTLLLAPDGKARVCGLRSEKEGEIIIVLARQQ